MNNPLRKDWQEVIMNCIKHIILIIIRRLRDSIMKEAIVAKFSQHENLYKLLLSTQEAELVEHTANDSYWGDGLDGSGKNKLGKISHECSR